MAEKWTLPAPAEVLDAIDEWRELNLYAANEKVVKGHFDRIFSKMLRVFQGETSTGGHTNFFRIRRKEEDLIDHINGLWAPAGKTKMGRCNFTGESVLYVSTDIANCFEELNIGLGELVYLIEYKIKPGGMLYRTTFGSDWAGMGMDEQIFANDESRISYRIMREFLRSEFMKPTCRACSGSDFIYHVTASICAYLRTVPNIYGFTYPSAVNLYSQNVALFPEARQKLEITDVKIVKLVDPEHYDLKLEHMYQGSIEGEAVSWDLRRGTTTLWRRKTAEDLKT